MRHVAFAFFLGLAVSACGGGGASFGGGIIGSGKLAVRVGALEQDGAVVIDGLAFESSMAAVTVSGMATPVADLRKGMVAIVTGTIDDTTGAATAERVEVETLVKGLVQAKLDAVTMTVLGQTVEVTPDTVFGPGINPASLDGLLVGDPVEIYGFLKSAGAISAARIELESGLSELRLTGTITNWNAGAQTFDIGLQTVSYAGADTSDLPGGTPANGLVVEVRGEPMLNAMSQVVANEVRHAYDDGPNDVDDVEVEGFVTAVSSPSTFSMGTQSVQTNGATVFEGGRATDIVVGIELEVDGSIVNGVLIAARVEFGESVKLESDVDTVVGTTITLVGLPGISVVVTAGTEFEGDANALIDVVPGDHVKIRGRMAGATTVTATRVDETSADPDVELQGPVDAAPAPSDPTLAILGVLVNTSGLSAGDFENALEQTITRAAFFAAATPGTLVRLSGTLGGAVVTWDEASLESGD